VVTGGNCNDSAPCPALADPSGQPAKPTVVVNNSPAAVYWTAPNQLDTEPDALNPLEDLALWTESSTTGSNDRCTISGQGAVKATGVFFHPNCTFQYAGQASNDNASNAQFVGRSMGVSGQAILRLAPSAKDSVKIPIAGVGMLIR
jgi:hypothetical protein